MSRVRISRSLTGILVLCLSLSAQAQLQRPFIQTLFGYDAFLKGRYLTIDALAGGANAGITFSMSVTLTGSLQFEDAAGMTWWVGAPDEDCIAGLVESEEFRTWDPCPVLHITGCGIVPVSEYAIVLSDGQGNSTTPLTVQTALRPGDKWWGDAVGSFFPSSQMWSPPQGVANIEEPIAAIKTFQRPDAIGPGCPQPFCNAAPVSVLDIHPQVPNRLVNIDDAFTFILAFQGNRYPYGCPHDPCWDKSAMPCP